MTVELINPDTKVVYIAIPKTASSSLAKSFANDGRIGPDHKSYSKILPMLRDFGIDPKSVFFVISVRHPYTRFESWAYDIDMRSERNFDIHWVNEGMTIDDLVEYVASKVAKADGGSTFTKIMDDRDPEFYPVLGSHIQPQSHFIINEEGEMDLNLRGIIRFENIDEDYVTVAKKIKAETGLDVPEFGFGYRKGGKTFLKSEERPGLSEKSKKILYDLYRKDFTTFGYQP